MTSDAAFTLECRHLYLEPQAERQRQGWLGRHEPEHLVEVGLLHRPDVVQPSGSWLVRIDRCSPTVLACGRAVSTGTGAAQPPDHADQRHHQCGGVKAMLT